MHCGLRARGTRLGSRGRTATVRSVRKLVTREETGGRDCTAPTATRILEILAGVARHSLLEQDGHLIQVFLPQLDDLQIKVLDMLGVPVSAYPT